MIYILINIANPVIIVNLDPKKGTEVPSHGLVNKENSKQGLD